MPRELWPAIAQHWSQAQSFEAMARNLEKLPDSVNQLSEGRELGSLPLRIVSAGRDSDGRANTEHVRDAALSRSGSCIVSTKAGHWIQLDDPDLAVDTIREVVELVSGVQPSVA